MKFLLGEMFKSRLDSFFVLFKNRRYEWSCVVDRVLSYRGRNRSAPKFVSLGPNGEYFIRLENGRMWWGGMSDVGNKRTRKLGNGSSRSTSGIVLLVRAVH